jgi:hypothetical protein
VPATVEASVPCGAAGAAAVAVLPLTMAGAALAVVANTPIAVASVAAVTAVPAIARKCGIFMMFLPLLVSKAGLTSQQEP